MALSLIYRFRTGVKPAILDLNLALAIRGLRVQLHRTVSHTAFRGFYVENRRWSDAQSWSYFLWAASLGSRNPVQSIADVPRWGEGDRLSSIQRGFPSQSEKWMVAELILSNQDFA